MFLIIDNGYYNFYRFFATLRWYNYSEERRLAAEGIEWLNNDTFMKTFEKMWFETIEKLCKKFNLSKSKIIFARDGDDVWRYRIYPEYKAHRNEINDDIHNPGPVFKYVNKYFHRRVQGAVVIRHSQAEADDIAAIAARYIRVVYPKEKVILITGDYDFLQLSEPGHVEIYKLQGMKEITVDDPHTALMMKVLAGDPSDNIPNIFKGCGKKTAVRLANDPVELNRALKKHGGSAQYQLNRQLVDFDYIPLDIVSDIESKLDSIL